MTKTCLICADPVEPFIDFGRMPIANGFLAPERFEEEYFFNLAAGRCAACGMVQLMELVDPARLFHQDYAYFSSISTRMARHFAGFAETVRKEWIRPGNPFVVEIGSNDGILLIHFKEACIRHLGVEPSSNVAAAARKKGINTVCRFFDEEAGREIRRKHGPADALLGANVFCHLPEIHSVMRGIDELLKDDGVLVVEDPWLGEIVAKTAYDQIYDEHVFYFSLSALDRLFARYGMEVVDAAPQDVHGGSMRYVVARKGARPVRPSVEALRRREAELGLGEAATFERFRAAVERSRDALVGILCEEKARGRRVTGYGATSKSTTVTNYCGIGPDLVEFISDTTPGKQGKFSPGAHIPVVPYERFAERPPDRALLFAWNHGEEIMAREAGFTAAGGRFILYVPDVRVLP